MRIGQRGFLTLVLVAVAIAAIVPPAHGQIQAEDVRTSLNLAVEYLKRTQNEKTGAWPDHVGHPGGVTALATLALLNAGVEPQDPKIQKALNHLRTIPPSNCYVTSLQTMVFCAAEPNKDRVLIRRNAIWLQEAQVKNGPNKGGWYYSPNVSAGGSTDNSNTQFALLALYEAERADVPVSDQVWKLALDYWTTSQNPDGSWGYPRSGGGSGSMTCAGIASLVIAADELSQGDAEVANGQVKCCGEQERNDALERALAWLEDHFSVERNHGLGGGQPWLFYYLYGVERAGRMTARRFIGDHDWYREGADFLVRNQDRLSGRWQGRGHAEDNPDIATSLAVLFMAKGRRPVLIGKLKHGPQGDWNHHRNDLHNLTSFVEKRWKHNLTWQIIDPAAASVEDLLQAPVLFISGKKTPEFSAEEKKNLRGYIDRGGFIFADGCCGGGDFDAGFRQLMKDVFPEPEYKLRLLPAEHPVWHAEESIPPEYMRPLWGLDIGCRTSVVYCPDDLSCYWELARLGREHKLPKTVKENVEAARMMGVNVLAYATNREIRDKSEFFEAPKAEKADEVVDRGRLYVAKLLHPGGCNAAPGALPNLLRVAGEKLKLRVATEPREVGMSDPTMFRYHMVFMHGRQNFRLTPTEQKQLRTYLERGGILLADSICTSKAFEDAFRREIKGLFPNQPLERIPVTHPMLTSKFGGEDLRTVSRREPQGGGADGGPLKAAIRQVEPELEGIKIGDRYAVIFSRYDISCALENHESLECEGYTRQDAARIALNVLLYSLHQ